MNMSMSGNGGNRYYDDGQSQDHQYHNAPRDRPLEYYTLELL